MSTTDNLNHVIPGELVKRSVASPNIYYLDLGVLLYDDDQQWNPIDKDQLSKIKAKLNTMEEI
jgi:hypothetical protein